MIGHGNVTEPDVRVVAMKARIAELEAARLREALENGRLREALRKCVRWMETYSPALASDSLKCARKALETQCQPK